MLGIAREMNNLKHHRSEWQSAQERTA
uniref:Uncharacterized protein n=1 Tax=Anguilla anguilla TaxID=7936 RepID=A0A0E9UEM4_ANGAN